MKFKYNYVARSPGDNKWEFRLLRSTKIRMYKSFFDVEYGGKKKSHQAALAFSDKTLSSLSKRIQRRLRNGYPKFKINSGVCLVTRAGIPEAYIAKVYNKFTGKIIRKSFSFGEVRSEEQASKLARKFRREQVNIVQQLALKYGYREI